MKRIFHSLFLLLIASSLFPLSSLKAQPTHSISLTGKVKDATTNKPIPYATVAIIDGDGKTRGAVTAEDGGFEITTPAGKMKLVVSCMGYVKHEAEQEVAKAEDLGDILLQPDTKELDEVVVKAVKPMIRREVGKIVLDAKSLAPIATNAIDLLRRTPGLLVSDDGSVTVVGKGSLLILINGQEKHLTGQEFGAYLRGLQAEDIKTIEVMTIPPAKYSAEGDVGIVNIVLQRKLSDYFGGTVSDTHFISKYQSNDAAASLKYQNGALFLYAGGMLGLGNENEEILRNRTYSQRKWEQHTDDKSANRYAGGNLGFEWGLPHQVVVGGHYAGISFTPDHEIEYMVNMEDEVSKKESHFRALNNIDNSIQRHNGGVFLEKHWERKSAVLDVNYVHYTLANKDHYRATGDNTYRYNNLMDRKTDLWSGKLDVSLPSNVLNIDFGTSYQYTQTDHTASFLENPLLPDQHDAFLHKEHIGAVYTDFVFYPLQTLVTQIGLRGEGTMVYGRQRDVEKKIDSKLFHLFPTLYLGYYPHEKHVLSLSFGRRISRPSFADINPFVRYIDQYNMVAGNPDLKPTISYNAELGYTFNNNLNVAFSYRAMKDESSTVPRLQSDGTLLHTEENSSDLRLFLLSTSYRWFPSDWFNAFVVLYGYHMQGVSNAYEKPITNQSLVFMAYSGLNVYFNQKKTWMAEIHTQYQTPEHYALSTSTPRFHLHPAIKYSALGGRLNVSAQLLYALKNDTGYTQTMPDYKEVSTTYVKRMFKLSLSYNFGGFIEREGHSAEKLYERLGK